MCSIVSTARCSCQVSIGMRWWPSSAAKQAGRGMLVGKSVSSVAEAVAAEQSGADYLVVEPVFFSHYAHDHSPLGPTLIRRIKAKVHLPLLAGGGITAGNAHQVIAAGADGVSVTTEIVDSSDPRAAARSLADAMREAWKRRPQLRGPTASSRPSHESPVATSR